MMRDIFYYGCNMLFISAKVIATLMVSSAMFQPRTEKTTRVVWWVAAVIGISGLDTVNQIITGILFSNNLMFVEILFLWFVIAGL